MTDETFEYPLKQTSSFALKKTTKGYTWDIKIYHDDEEELKKRIKELNEWAQGEYGNEM